MWLLFPMKIFSALGFRMLAILRISVLLKSKSVCASYLLHVLIRTSRLCISANRPIPACNSELPLYHGWFSRKHTHTGHPHVWVKRLVFVLRQSFVYWYNIPRHAMTSKFIALDSPQSTFFINFSLTYLVWVSPLVIWVFHGNKSGSL